MNKVDGAALRQKIQKLEGLTDDERAALLELAAGQRRYGLVWEDRTEDVEERLREQLPVLVEDKSLRIVSETSESSETSGFPNHILIEGDNLEALTALSYTHEGKVDVIYIDPPYNTGNRDFVYNDRFVDSEDSYRHSKWLSFMSKRLRIAKRLLSDRGVIFISIDDNEQANLKLLCDEVFGDNHFVSLFIWKSRQNKDNRNVTGVSIDHEYVLCYSKREGVRALKGSERKSEQYSNPDNDPRGPWASGNMAGLLDATQRPNCHYDLINPETGINYGRPKMGWRYDQNTMNRLIKENRILWPESSDGRPRKKTFLSEISAILPGFSSVIGDEIYTRTGTKQLDDIFEKRPFDFPKPVELIQQLVQQCTQSHSTVLDFFAGSGTTLHAVMQLNKEDGGKRQCILVTNNENNICREVTYERNRRVIEGYTTPKGVQVEGLRANNLRYYRTRLLPRERTNRNMRALVGAATDLLCIKENLFEELQTPEPRIQARDARLFSDGQRAMLVVYNEEAIHEVVEWLQSTDANAKLSTLNSRLKTYVFSPGAYAWDDDFAPVLDRVELCALPEAIYQAYKSVLPKKKKKNSEVSEISETKTNNKPPYTDEQ
mgnify:CR=1 FL=1